MSTMGLALLTAALIVATPDDGTKVFELGPSPARGLLVNVTGGRPTPAPIDLMKPTVVVVHGLNPFHPLVHYTVAERYAEAMAQRHGNRVNVLAWDWNANTLPNLWPRLVDQHSIDQGRYLGNALAQRGIEPTNLHLIGQSQGCIVATSAARCLREITGRATARLTLIDPAYGHHPILFETLGASSAAGHVEHIWITGLSGFGREARYMAVQNIRLQRSKGLRGYLRPSHIDHYNAVRWHIDQLGR
jgi:prepilin-type processing-associated H-X9-DG protein